MGGTREHQLMIGNDACPEPVPGAARMTGFRVLDLRLPTSAMLDGSDAMNPDPDYSSVYRILESDVPRLEGHALTFIIGRGGDRSCAAIRADGAGFWRRITGDSQLRWVGPGKGVIHLATAAVVNAVWEVDEAIAYVNTLASSDPPS